MLQPFVSPWFLDALRDQFHGRLRLRWSPVTNTWHIEQRVGRAALPPRRGEHDRLVRARDGYAHVMTIQPHPRAHCPRCGSPLDVPVLATAEVRCGPCTRLGRDARYALGYWPLNERLLAHLHRISPEHNGALTQMREQDLTLERRLVALERHTRNQTEAGLKEDIHKVLGLPRVGGFYPGGIPA